MLIFCANNIPLTPLGIKVYGRIISQQFAPKKLALILEQQKLQFWAQTSSRNGKPVFY